MLYLDELFPDTMFICFVEKHIYLNVYKKTIQNNNQTVALYSSSQTLEWVDSSAILCTNLYTAIYFFMFVPKLSHYIICILNTILTDIWKYYRDDIQ